MERLPPPAGYFLRSPSRTPPPSPLLRTASPLRRLPAVAYARSASHPRPLPPAFYRVPPPPPGFHRLSPPRMDLPPLARSPPRSPPRSPSRSPPRVATRSRSEWRAPPPPATATSFQRGRSLSHDDPRPPSTRTEPATASWRDKKPQQQQQQQQRAPALAKRVMSLSAFCGEVLDAHGKLLPSSKRPRTPNMPIPTPLLFRETPEEFETAFRNWLRRRKDMHVDDLRADPNKERVFRFSFAYSRLPTSAWYKDGPPTSSRRLEPSAARRDSSATRSDPSVTRSDPRDSRRPSLRPVADPMPPRAKPYKRSRSAEQEKNVRVQPETEPEPEAKRPRRASPRDPRVRHDAAGDTSWTAAIAREALGARDDDDIDGIPISDIEAQAFLSRSAAVPSTNQVNGNGAFTKPTTPPSTKTSRAVAPPAKEKPQQSNKAAKANRRAKQDAGFDEAMPKWAAALLRRVQDLEDEVRDLRHQLGGQEPNCATQDCREADSIKVDHDDISKDDCLAEQPTNGDAAHDGSDASDARDLVKTQLAAAYNDLNDEILLNEHAVAESDEFVRDMMATDERQARELQGQIHELRAAIEQQKSRRDESLAALVAHCWKDRRAALADLLAVPLNTQDVMDILQASYAKCARLAAQAKRLAANSGGESTAEEEEEAAAVARVRLEREQEAEYALLLTASERVRDMVCSLLDAQS